MQLVETDPLEIDRAWVSRLLMGGLTEHEQRLLVVRALRGDGELRATIREAMASIVSPDIDFAARYGAALAAGIGDEDLRRSLLESTVPRVGDLEAIARGLTYEESRNLDGPARTFYTWSMAERLLEIGRAEARRGDASARARLYMAEASIDGFEILGAVGKIPRLREVVVDLRRRLRVVLDDLVR